MKILIHMKRPRPRLAALRTHWRRWLAPSLFFLTALPVYAQSGSDPWENAVNVLKTAFTGTIATGLSLVAIVVGGLMFAMAKANPRRPSPESSSAWWNGYRRGQFYELAISELRKEVIHV